MKTYVLSQNYEEYTEQDHQVWRELCRRQDKLDDSKIANVYLDGFKRLKINKERIPNIYELSEKLEAISGWTLLPVSGLLPPKDFFMMLINKSYPITVSIRKREELNFSEQPDIFHDICGHLPLLTNDRFVKFLTAYCVIAIKYVKNEKAIEFLGRLYWYTYEMGLIKEGNTYKPFGGAIVTSSSEIDNIYQKTIPVHQFDLNQIFNTLYNPYSLQKEYFFIENFEELFLSLNQVEEKLVDLLMTFEPDSYIVNYPVNKKLGKEFNNVIGFLNDIQFEHPDAVSLVAGQPDDDYFDIQNHLEKFKTFVNYRKSQSGNSELEIINSIGQYSKTKGIINDIISKYLQNDENILLDPKDLLVTVGAQEAFSVIVSTICNREEDIIMIEDPSYIGVSSFSKVFDYNLEGVKMDAEGMNLSDLRDKILDLHSNGKRVKLVYVIPDHQNPTGSSMPIGSRLKLLELAEKYNFLIIEDSVYNSFTYKQQRIPTLKSMDKFNRVIYVGSFSKSIFPGLRIGLIGANQKIENEYGQIVPLIDEMTKVKAQLTNNTPTISQAILGGILIDKDFSLSSYNEVKYQSYKIKLEKVLKLLDEKIGRYKGQWAKDIRWTEPQGGFFIKVTVPFRITEEDIRHCAEEFRVLFCPMWFFYLDDKNGRDELRITFSNLNPDQIEEGITNLSNYLRYRVMKESESIKLKTEAFNN